MTMTRISPQAQAIAGPLRRLLAKPGRPPVRVRKAGQRAAVYDERGRLLGTVDPARVQRLASLGSADGGERAKTGMAVDPVHSDELQPQPPDAAGVHADASTVAKAARAGRLTRDPRETRIVQRAIATVNIARARGDCPAAVEIIRQRAAHVAAAEIAKARAAARRR